MSRMPGRSGLWKKNLSGDASYLSFVPAALTPDPTVSLCQEDLGLLVEANRKLAYLDGLSSRIPNVRFFISMHVRKEALMSSQIEGTQATLEDILDPLAGKNANRDVADVVNYIKATEHALRRRKDLPLCNRLICETHAILMEGARGHDKAPGEFRRSQNWIGGHGSTLRTARYIPPTAEDMLDAMGSLERYMNDGGHAGGMDPLVQAALAHYQFETIHPFLDGNGRIGRLLVTLFLMERHVLSAPVLYISYSLKRNRAEYYDRMTAVRERGDYEQWVRFFLAAILETANDAIETIGRMAALHDRNAALANSVGRSKNTAMRVFAYIEENPIIGMQRTAEALGMAYNTVSGAVDKLRGAGILAQTGGAQRNRTFAYSEYLDILRNGTE